MLPWLYGIATNVVRNRRRAERRYRAALARVPLPRPELDFRDEAIDRIHDERRMALALGLLAALPRQQRDVVVLCEWSGLSYEDAAFALGVPAGTVARGCPAPGRRSRNSQLRPDMNRPKW